MENATNVLTEYHREEQEAIQKTMLAPSIRNVVRANALIGPNRRTAFDAGDINPHMMLAPSMAKCPL